MIGGKARVVYFCFEEGATLLEQVDDKRNITYTGIATSTHAVRDERDERFLEEKMKSMMPAFPMRQPGAECLNKVQGFTQIFN